MNFNEGIGLKFHLFILFPARLAFCLGNFAVLLIFTLVGLGGAKRGNLSKLSSC